MYGHKGVRLNLRPNWVERVEETSEQLECTLIQDWADEPHSESLAISNVSSEEQNEALPRIQVEDRIQLTNLGQQNQEWIGEVAEVAAFSEGCVRVTVEIVYPTE